MYPLKKSTIAIVVIVAIGLGATGAWLWWHGRVPAAPEPAPPPPVVATPAPVASAPAATVETPTIQYPVEVPEDAVAVVGPLDVEDALGNLFGRKAVLSLFQLPDFARRVVATVDNLGRTHAPPALWPLNPASGRFLVETQEGVEVISADNGLRYTPYLLLAETVDLRRVAAFYTRLYPLLQQAYEDIGYPNRYFNDRLVEVIDQLLATPDVTTPLVVRLPVVKGPIPVARPWVTYEFVDPRLQSLSAGQKMLLRMGPVNQRRMKSKLAEIRRLVVANTVTR